MSYEFDEKCKKTFCPLPWNHSFVNQDGSYQVCCTSEEFDNVIRTNSGEKAYIQSGLSASDLMNSNYMKQIRKKMLSGEWPSICKRCEISESMNGVSRRNVEISGYKSSINRMLINTQEDGSISYPITSADYRLGNLCNLQCRMCNPRSTKLWIGEWNEIKPERERFPQNIMDSYKKYNWIDSEELVKDFEEKAPYLEHIHFAGGEPLIVPQMSRILEKCIQSGNSKNITVTYNTNLTVLPKRIINLWKNFKGIKILASIDAIGDLNHYIRFPSEWEEIDKNLKSIDKHYEEYNIIECMLSTTVQALNVCSLETIYEYLSQFEFVVKAPNLVNLHFPKYLATTSLPQSLKRIAMLNMINIKKKYMNSIPDNYSYLLENINNIIQFMISRDGFKEGDFDLFKKFNYEFDERKKLKIEDYCPEFKTLI
jgi:organic radical activating enzyme